MTLKHIAVTNAYGRLQMDIKDQDDPDIVVVSIDGLGSPDGEVNISGGPTFNGGLLNSSRVGTRKIEMTLAIRKHGPAGDAVRQKIYRHFPITGTVLFEVQTDSRTGYSTMVVTENSMNMFSETQHCVIGLESEKSYLNRGTNDVVKFYGVQPLFTFPFSNPSLTENLLVFSEGYDVQEKTITYDGDVKTGIIFYFDFMDLTGIIRFYNNTYSEGMSIDPDAVELVMGSPIQAGDRIVVDTRPRHKSATLVRNGVEYNILHAIERIGGTWINLYPGPNDIVYLADSGSNNVSMILEHDTLYEGV